MLVKAQVSFSGALVMHLGETREIANDEIAKDLLRAGYIVEVKAGTTKAKAKAPAVTEPEPVVETPAEEVPVEETPVEEVEEKTTKKGK